MTGVESIQSLRTACFEKSGSLPDMRLAIEQKRGALYMRETSGVLIEKWNLRSDRLDDQSSDTLDLVAKLLKL
jgi:hypothetical protein